MAGEERDTMKESRKTCRRRESAVSKGRESGRNLWSGEKYYRDVENYEGACRSSRRSCKVLKKVLQRRGKC